MRKIEKIAVIGSGVMGAGIAGQIANAGYSVVLLDIVLENSEDRNELTKKALDNLINSSPPALADKSVAKKITIGNLEDNLNLLEDMDWIIEVIVEKLEIKKELYKKIDSVRKRNSIISSNTSTLPLKELVDGMSKNFKKDFLISHFFNPPRYMRLLELIVGPSTDKKAIDVVKEFTSVHMGKGVVECKDTPGFIANRIGCFWLEVALNEAIKLGISVEDADAVMGKPVGIPRTAVFGLWDLIGIDLMPLIASSILNSLPDTDEYNKIYTEHKLTKTMIEDGYTGRKGKGGFYRMTKSGDGKKVKEVIDLKTGEYSKTQGSKLKSAKMKFLELMEAEDIGGQYTKGVMTKFLSYAASLVPEISDDIYSVDEAMKLGYNWKYGPFELIDIIGAKNLAKELDNVPAIIEKLGDRKFYDNGKYFDFSDSYKDIPEPSGIIRVADYKDSPAILASEEASLWDIGDGIACIEFTTKMNFASHGVLEMIQKSIEEVEKNYKALVIGNDAPNFCVGGNLQFMLDNAKQGNFDAVASYIKLGQDTVMALKYAKFPVVSAVKGYAMGGGTEIILHSTASCIHIESYSGLVETKVGILPAWGGSKEMLLRSLASGDSNKITQAFKNILYSVTSTSALNYRNTFILGDDMHMIMNIDHVLADARSLAIKLSKDFKAKRPQEIYKGDIVQLKDQLMKSISQDDKLSEHDLIIAEKIANVFSGGSLEGSIDEQALLDIERHEFTELTKLPKTQERIEHMLKTGKPLKN